MTLPKIPRSRNWLLALALVLLVAGTTVLIVRISGVRKLEGAGADGRYGSSDRTDARANSGPTRDAALTSIRAGEYAKAFGYFGDVSRAEWRAEDCHALGTSLLERDYVALGWAALEAGRRIDPRHKPSVDAIEKFHKDLARARAPEQLPQQIVAEYIEYLREVSGGPPLATLALGLAAFASSPADEDEFLDRIVIGDRAWLRGVKTPAAAILQLARVLLGAGRPGDAQALLTAEMDRAAKGQGRVGPPSSPAGASANTTAPDQEAAWLLSRAALQLDQKDLADAMLARAGEFAKTASAVPEPSPFVGSKRCGDCHGAIFRSQQFESHHSETLRFGKALEEVPLPEQPVKDPLVPRLIHTFSRGADDRIDVAVKDGDQIRRAVVEYAVGSGHQGITMIARDESSIPRSLRISYLHNGEHWSSTKGADATPRDAGETIGRGLGAQSLRKCVHCHATWFGAAELAHRGPARPEASDRGIGCERCHGPGLNHVKAVESGFSDPAIAISAKTPAGPRLESCTECHAADGSIKATDPEFTRAQGTTLLFSRCYTGARDRFVCTTCHDPHKAVDTRASMYEAKCLGCHLGGAPAIASGTSAPRLPAESAHAPAPACPVNPKSGCIECHMPKVPDASRHARFTDHHIRIHREPAAVTNTGSGL